MTNQQIADAITMHESGITWEVIAAYYKTTVIELRKHRKLYETNSTIHRTTA